MTRLGRALVAVALAIPISTCGGSKTPTGPGSPGAGSGASCRTYPTVTSVAATQSGLTINSQMTGTFDSASKKSTTTSAFVIGGLCSTTVTNYNSVADFVDEVAVIPGVTLATSNTTTNSAFCGTGIQAVTFTYDSQRRLTRFSSAGGTTTYTAWDSSGRPAAGSTNGITISNVYDNTARTLTQTQVANGAQTVTTITYDTNGNQVSSVVTGAGGGTTTTYTNTATATVCK